MSFILLQVALHAVLHACFCFACPAKAVAELYYEMMDGFLRWRAKLADHESAAVPPLSEDEPLGYIMQMP